MKVNFKLTLIFLCAIILLTAAGCAKSSEKEIPDEEIIGEWTESIFDSGYIFNEDSTGEDTFWLLPFTYTTKGGILTITYDDEMWGESVYTYEITGNVLTLTGEDRPSFSYSRN